MDTGNTGVNVSNAESTSPPSIAANQLPAQYSYDNFDQVLVWITHFSSDFVKCTAAYFWRHLRVRDCYLSRGDTGGVESVENLIKNYVGYLRFEEETENFRQKFAGKCAVFWQGKFLGWLEDVPYNPSLRGVVLYEICET
jgi:hypothetical protein